jgi:LCP family protein required for cell wall assembly
MSYSNEPTQKLYPRQRKVGAKVHSVAQFRPGDLPPMPSLEELSYAYLKRGELEKRPTAPLEQSVNSADDFTRFPTVPLRRTGNDVTEGADQPLERLRRASRRVPKERPLAPTRLKKRNKKRLARRTTLLFSLLCILVVLGGALISGLYVVEKDVLGPLAQFFHPLGGDSNGSIDGRAWNLLLLGSDNDAKFTFPDVLTQVMMVVRVDPLNNSVSMLSIPRDSWVAVPGQAGMHKIDQAFFIGSRPHRSFDDGVRLARQTIEQDYGIPIARYAWVGLDGFARVINTLGGIDIDVTHPLLDDNYPDDTGSGGHAANPYAVERLYLAPGPQHLSGEQALEYVRSRHADLVGDIGRTQRQQEVLAALKKKLDFSTVFNHLSALFHDLAGKVYTDLSEKEMLSIANFARNLSTDSISHITLGPGHGSQNYGSLARVNDPGLDASQDIIVPNCATIQPEVNTIFGLGDIQSCQVNGGG